MRFVLFLLGILIWTGAATQSYPAKPVRVIVPFPPGQAADIFSRMVKILALTTAQRVPQLPEVPTLAESGYDGFSGVGCSGLVLPAGTPRELVEKVSADTQAVLREPETVQRIVERGGVPDPTTPQQYAEFIRAEVAKWGEVARLAKVKLD